MNRAMQLHQIAVQSMSSEGHVIVCGYGRSGKALVNFLEQENIRTIALDLDSHHVRSAATSGRVVVYGDAAKREVLMAAGLMRAKVLVVSYNDQHSSLRILRQVKELRPDLPVVIRTTDDSHISALKEAGAAEVVAEVTEGSVMLASQALLHSGIPLPRVIRRIQETRARRYSMFSGYLGTAPAGDATERLQVRFRSILLKTDDHAVGRTLDDVNLDALQVTTNAVRRHNTESSTPSGDLVLQAGDVLVLLGSPDQLDHAEQYLRDGQ